MSVAESSKTPVSPLPGYQLSSKQIGRNRRHRRTPLSSVTVVSHIGNLYFAPQPALPQLTVAPCSAGTVGRASSIILGELMFLKDRKMAGRLRSYGAGRSCARLWGSPHGEPHKTEHGCRRCFERYLSEPPLRSMPTALKLCRTARSFRLPASRCLIRPASPVEGKCNLKHKRQSFLPFSETYYYYPQRRQCCCKLAVGPEVPPPPLRRKRILEQKLGISDDHYLGMA